MMDVHVSPEARVPSFSRAHPEGSKKGRPMREKRSVTIPGEPAPPTPLERRPAVIPSGEARETRRMEAKDARLREVMIAHRAREAELTKQGYCF